MKNSYILCSHCTYKNFHIKTSFVQHHGARKIYFHLIAQFHQVLAFVPNLLTGINATLKIKKPHLVL